MSKSIYRYKGDKIDVFWDKTRCLHVAECILGLRAVFDPSEARWVRPDNDTPDRVASVIHRCPTGALRYERKDGSMTERPDHENTARVAADGPLYLRGDIRIAVEDETASETRVALCRCGKSGDKPYCDGSHTRVGFEDDGHGIQKALADTLRTGSLTILPRPDGPLFMQGPLEIESADGRIIYRGEKVSLCRCGESQTKPFCDGSHKDFGFRSG